MSRSAVVPEYFWRIGGDTGGVICNFRTDSQAAPVIGDTVDVTVSFDRLPGEAPREYRDRHAALLAYAKRNGEYALPEPGGGGVRYVETHDGNVPTGSLLVAVQPPADFLPHEGRGFWALVSDVNDETNLPQTDWALELSLARLAPLERFLDNTGQPDFAACRAALEREGI